VSILSKCFSRTEEASAMLFRSSVARTAVFLSLLFWGIGSASPVAADLIVDTGTPPITNPSGQGDPIVASYQWLAGEFQLTQAHTITAMQGYLSSNGPAATFTMTLYSDGGDIPGTALFSSSALAPPVTFNGLGQAVPDWYGSTGTAWTVGPGIYWIAVEVRPGDTLEGFMPIPAPNPLSHEAIANNGPYGPTSNFAGTFGFGFRVFGEASVACEPRTIALLLLCGLPLLHCRPSPHRKQLTRKQPSPLYEFGVSHFKGSQYGII
jgi:hypothetical protein